MSVYIKGSGSLCGFCKLHIVLTKIDIICDAKVGRKIITSVVSIYIIGGISIICILNLCTTAGHKNRCYACQT